MDTAAPSARADGVSNWRPTADWAHMADPLLSCSDQPVCYGDWKVLRGHIAGESHGLRHSPRALCVVDPGNIIPGPFLRNYPAVSRAYWRLPPAPPAVTAWGRCCWRPAGEGRAGTTAPRRLRPLHCNVRNRALLRTARLPAALGLTKLPKTAPPLQGEEPGDARDCTVSGRPLPCKAPDDGLGSFWTS